MKSINKGQLLKLHRHHHLTTILCLGQGCWGRVHFHPDLHLVMLCVLQFVIIVNVPNDFQVSIYFTRDRVLLLVENVGQHIPMFIAQAGIGQAMNRSSLEQSPCFQYWSTLYTLCQHIVQCISFWSLETWLFERYTPYVECSSYGFIKVKHISSLQRVDSPFVLFVWEEFVQTLLCLCQGFCLNRVILPRYSLPSHRLELGFVQSQTLHLRGNPH